MLPCDVSVKAFFHQQSCGRWKERRAKAAFHTRVWLSANLLVTCLLVTITTISVPPRCQDDGARQLKKKRESLLITQGTQVFLQQNTSNQLNFISVW